MPPGDGMCLRREPRRPRRAVNPRLVLRRCAGWAVPQWRILTFGAVCTLGSVFLSQQPPRLYRYTIDTVIGQARYQEVGRVVLLYIGILVAGQIVSALSRYWMSVAGQRLLHNLRLQLYEHMQSLPLSFFDNHRVGDLMMRITGDVRQIESLILQTGNSLVRQVFGMGFALYYMLRYSPLLTFLILIPVPVLAVTVVLFTRRMRVLYRAMRESMGNLGAKLQENLSGIRVIQAFHREPLENQRVAGVSGEVLDRSVKASRMAAIVYPMLSLISASGAVIVLGVGAVLISRDALTIGALTAFSMYIAHFYHPVNEFVHTFDTVQRALASGERIFEILDTVPDIRDPDDPVPLAQPRGAVSFEHVEFRYPNGEMVLHDINVQVKPGQRIALVGRSGAGKTTFVNLIPRFYDPAAGTVRVDGIDVRRLRLKDLRQSIGMVLQETFLFDGTIGDNLRYGAPGADESTIKAAAVVANAHEFIEKLPQGYQTPVGERGIKLSGGQKQRMAIARAVLANPRILIMDEATSSVDGESEHLINEALQRLMRGRTTFVIAHRLSTVRDADRILVLEDGCLTEDGSHAGLLSKTGWYADMVRRQVALETGAT